MGALNALIVALIIALIAGAVGARRAADGRITRSSEFKLTSLARAAGNAALGGVAGLLLGLAGPTVGGWPLGLIVILFLLGLGH